MRAIAENLKRFYRSRAGNVAMIFGLSAFPLFGSAGAAFDYARAMIVRARLAEAVDAAGLAIGSAVGLDLDQMQTMAQQFFDANYPDEAMGVPSEIIVTASADNRFRLTAQATLETTLLGIVGIHEFHISVASEITRESKGLEVALVLDTTGSMGSSGKIEALRQAATDLVTILFGDVENANLLKVGIVPFAGAVRLNPTTAVSKGWIDTTGTSSVARYNFDTSLTANNYAYAIYPKMKNVSWRGCVELRPSQLDETDTPPGTGDTRWVPFFAPDEPDDKSPNWSGAPNNYISDKKTGNNFLARQNYAKKYENVSNSGPHRECGMQEITPLISSRTTLLNNIAALNADGYTHIANGLGWGWRVLSPTEPFTEGTAYDDEEFVKALVLMTDGDNTVKPGISKNDYATYTALGYPREQRLGAGINTTSEMTTEQNNAVARVCQSIKDAGIRLYSITLMVSNSTTQNLFRNCASDPSLYFESPTAADLQPVFLSIAQDLSNLRLSQ